MAHTPEKFYLEQKEALTQELSKLKKRLFASSMLRLLVFVLMCFGIYSFFGDFRFVLGVIVVGVALFIYLISRHSNLQGERNLKQALIHLNETELRVLDRDFHHLQEGSEFQDSEHFYSQDIDLFGKGSFFQYLNRTALESGRKLLAHQLKSNHIQEVNKKQEAIQELAGLAKWRQHFSGIALLVKAEIASSKVVAWLNEYQSFIPAKMKYIPSLFSLGSLAVFILYFMGFVPELVLTAWFFIGLGISGLYVKKINTLAIHTSEIASTFEQFHKLLQEIEQHEFKSHLLKDKRHEIINEVESASSILYQFSRHLDGLDQRNNILIAIFTNAFMLRDIQQVLKIEDWISKHKTTVGSWFKIIAFFDAYNSLGNFVFNHPTYLFPVIVNEQKDLIDGKELGHPLLDPKVCVNNDFRIDQEQFFIITGANMAGKSTFLRTVSLQIVMANMGLPVLAASSRYHPIKLITSMRTTDSLTNDESYFFSELKRLKFIVEEIKNDRYFIILDEILKGTNSTDKAIGSRKFIDKLVASKSTGIIATHDLSLCEAANDLSAVKNYYFDAQIENDELYFDYKFKEGICKNMNASFLLKKMKIID